MAEAAEDMIASRMAAILNPAPPEEEAPAEEAPVVEAPVEAAAEETTEETPEEAVAEEASEEVVDEAAEDDVPTVSTFAELAEHLNVPMNELYQAAVAMDIEGEHKEVSISELKDAFQASERLEKRAAEITQMREEAQRITEEAQQQSEHKILESVAILESVEKRLMEDVNAIDWNTLRQEDPSEWAARKQELMERQAMVEADKQRVNAAFQQHVQQKEAATQEQTTEHLARERQKLLDAIPSWTNEATMTAEIAEIREYLGGAGFRAEEIDGLSDHRHVLLIRKARALDKQAASVDATKKRLVKIGSKIAKPGSSATKTKTSRSEAEQIRARLKKSGSVDDFAALLTARNRG